MDRRRTSGHSGANAGCGRSQLRVHAFHASCRLSSANPGRSDQRTGCQRLLPCRMAGPDTAASGAAPGARAGGASPAGGSGTLAQPASVPTMIANPRKRFMLLILLEALLALVVLVAIVWWTMFAGRKRGEPPREDGP